MAPAASIAKRIVGKSSHNELSTRQGPAHGVHNLNVARAACSRAQTGFKHLSHVIVQLVRIADGILV